ncbi:MAG: IS66 family transposase [Proteobacteria bacterium]|nr:IS66 family transposase [Pseudomonadota bacterium]
MPPKSLTGKAIAYSLKRGDALTLFLEHPEIPLDNNTAENAIRPFVIGRKNFLFSDTPKGAEAKANNLNPATYLQTLFERFPFAEGDEQLRALLPQYIDLTTTDSDC